MTGEAKRPGRRTVERRLPEALRRRVLALDTASLCDAGESVRVLDAGLRPLRRDLKLFGSAYTVSCRDDVLTVLEALRDASSGDVLVIDGRGGRAALAGELVAAEASRKGLGGLVVEGSVRDTASLEAMDFPVYARWVFPRAGAASRRFETQGPVTVGGVLIQPGDVLFGDADGIVLVSLSELERAIPAAEAIQKKEKRALESVGAGKSLLELLSWKR